MQEGVPDSNRWQTVLTAFLKAAAGFALAAALLLAALPTLLSTAKGTQLGCAIATRFLPGTVEVQQVHKASTPWALTCKRQSLQIAIGQITLQHIVKT